MKASAALPILLLFAVSCSETPRTPTELAPPSSASGVIRGNPPPPPADAIVVVCVDGGACATFDGDYMTNQQSASSLIGAPTVSFASWSPIAQREEGTCTFPANSWLKINRNLDIQSITEGETSANAQLKCRDLIATGNGIIEVGGFEVNLENVDLFDNQPECIASCGQFIVHDEEGNEIATGFVFEREYFEEADCTVFEGEGEGGVFCDDDNGEGGS